MTKEQYKAACEAELADLEIRIANYDMSHDSINGFISKDARLRKMKKREAALKNVLATDLA